MGLSAPCSAPREPLESQELLGRTSKGQEKGVKGKGGKWRAQGKGGAAQGTSRCLPRRALLRHCLHPLAPGSSIASLSPHTLLSERTELCTLGAGARWALQWSRLGLFAAAGL